MKDSFWNGKKVFVTGHTGFKGSWLSLWLHTLGAEVTGYALPPSSPSLFELAEIDKFVTSIHGDIRDLDMLRTSIERAQPEIVLHLAAQPLVRESYLHPVKTFAVNVMGTVNVLEAVRHVESVKSVVNVTTDKVYENREWIWGYRENEPLGGYDPYSSSKACSELITASYRSAFFHPDIENQRVSVATARAGNVIGGGDWARDRLIPDCVHALRHQQSIVIRNPDSVRPWQHVLEPLSGYLLLAEKLYNQGATYAMAWNFGPDEADAKPVSWVVSRLCSSWGSTRGFTVDPSNHPHEAGQLMLDSSMARYRLGWRPRWRLEEAIDKVVEWVRCVDRGERLRDITVRQIEEYMKCSRGEDK